MGRVDGKVVFITGVARGQGRAHATRFAEEGADVIGIDICDSIDSVDYPPATEEDLRETERLVKATGRRIYSAIADVRDGDAVQAALTKGLAEFGRLDAVIANAGIMGHPAKFWQFTDEQWRDAIDVNLTGVWQTLRAATPVLIDQGTGGSVIITASTGGLKGAANLGNYVASKHGVIGFARTAAQELGEYGIRVNCLVPTGVDTHLIQSQELYDLFRPDIDKPTREDTRANFEAMHLLPVPWVEPSDIAAAALWLASDESRYVTGLEMRVDCGYLTK